MSIVAIIAAEAGQKILTVLAKSLSHAAYRLHKGAFHQYAEACKKRDVEAGYSNYKQEIENADKK